MRCRCCDAIFTEADFRLNSRTENLDDLCLQCAGESYRAAMDLELDQSDTDVSVYIDFGKEDTLP